MGKENRKSMKANDENQKLKKQLEEYKNKYIKKAKKLLAEGTEIDPEDLYIAELEQRAMDCEAMEIQQKEFIKFLEDSWKETQDIWYIKILHKYKEITGMLEED